MVWDAARITPSSWANILEYYRYVEERNDDFRPLGHLVEYVAAQPYAATLAGATSGTALLVAPHAQADWTHDAVRIDVDLSGSIRLSPPRKGSLRPAIIACEGPRIVGVFETFLRKARWIAP
jgi:hypothetical protein